MAAYDETDEFRRGSRATGARAAAPSADIHLLTAYANALKAEARLDEAIAVYERAARETPASGVAEHNLAGALGDGHRFAESEAATRRALAKGLDAPETWLVRGRSLQGLGEFDEAEAAFRQAIRRRPTYADARSDLARLIWMRSEDLTAARREIASAPNASRDPALAVALADLLHDAGHEEDARAALAEAAAAGEDVQLLVAAAIRFATTDPARSIDYAERALRLDPDAGPTRAALCQAFLAAGRAAEAAELAEQLRREWPVDQFPVALLATAWRLMGDQRYGGLYDYDRLVRAFDLETPPGWATLSAYMTDLAAALRRLHSLRGHPIGQSLRQGVQTQQSLAVSADPVVRALFAVLNSPIRAYIEELRQVSDDLGCRVADGYRFSGAWSAWLRPGGFHIDHLHPLGWISSACHIELPEAVDHGLQGWLKFGEPGVPTAPPLAAEHFVKPKVGRLVLFPSYMWHGTVPFTGSAPRLAVAFDLLPARSPAADLADPPRA